MKRIKLVFLLSIILSYSVSGQWINKNENTNYVQRHECSFVQSGDRFIMFGGREQAKRLDIYNYTNNTWSQGAQAPLEFNHFQATQYDGWVWVIAAFKTNNFPNETPAENVYLYHPDLNIWVQGPTIPQNRRRGGAGLVLHNDKFYVVAGNRQGHNGGYVNQFDEYDPVNNTWKALKNAPRARDHFSAVVINNKLYAASGRLSGGPGGVFAPLVAEVDVYDFNTNNWSTLPSSRNLPTPRAGASVVNFENELFVIGGEGAQSGPSFKKVEAYNPMSNSWTAKPNMNFSRHGTQAIVSGPGIHIAGGSPVRGGGRQHNMEVYQSDRPTGAAIKASTLNAVTSVTFSGIESKNIAVSSSSGNAGNFITKIALTGPNANDFSLQTNLEKHFIKSGTSQNISVMSNTSAFNKTANLIITYDNNKKVTISLKTETTTTTNPQSPFGNSPRQIPGTIEAEDYDNGGQGVAYNDTDSNNNGPNVAREDESVDLEARDGGINVGWTASGEWLEYTVNTVSGNYDLEARIATTQANRSFVVKLDDTTLGTFDLPNTAGWGSFQTIKIPNVNISGGNAKVLRIEFISGGINLNWIKFTTVDTGQTPTNLIKNPGFETGDLNSWGGFSNREVVNNNANTGNFAVKVTGVAGAQQIVNLKPNTQYTLSAQIKTQGGQGILGVKDYGGPEKGVGTTASNYTSKSLSFTTGSSNTSANIYLFIPNNGTIAFGDDFSLVESAKLAKSEEAKNLVTLYPNPTESEIRIRGIKNYDMITIADSSGRIVIQQKVSKQEDITMDVSKLGSGNYFISLTNNTIKDNFQFIRN